MDALPWHKDRITPPYGIHHPNRVKINVLGEAQNWRCAYCGIRCEGGQDEHNAATRDHIVPKCKGGFEVSDWQNEVMACLLCNNHRGAMWARQYFQRVQWTGREKAAEWARRKARQRS